MSEESSNQKKAVNPDHLAREIHEQDVQLELENVKKQLSDVQEQLEIVYRSLSWRLTKPIRFVGRVLRRARDSIFSFPARARFLIGVGVRYLIRLNFLPSRFKYPLIALLLRIRNRIFLPFNTDSNKKMMMHLALGRETELDRKVVGVIADLPDITISVVTHNSAKWIEEYVQSLITQKYPLDRISLIFVDNDSTDQTVSAIDDVIAKYSSTFSSVKLFRRPNLGFGAGHNFAMRKAATEYVLVSNVDLQFEFETIKVLVEYALNDRMKTASWECRQKPYEHPKYFDPVTLETSWSSHACVLISRSAYLSVGGYEKKIFMYGEDVEISYRFRDQGFSTKYVPDAVVWHYTYEHENQVKTLQFTGSTLANAYIRIRFGSFTDIISVFGLYAFLIVFGAPLKKGRLLILKNLGKIIVNLPYFLNSRKTSTLSFPFRGWDYERQREGAFYNCKKIPDNPPKVSVIIRTYHGRGRWLKESIASVINQTYKNIELVIVEDGSNSFEPLAARIRAMSPDGFSVKYSAQPKRGRSYNGNVGLKIATGEYAVFLDDDDLFYPDHIETLVNEIITREDIDGVYSLAWEVETDTKDGDSVFYEEHSHIMNPSFKQEFCRETLLHHNFMPIQSVLFRRSLFDKFGGFDVSLDALEDWVLWVKYSSKKPFHYVEKMTSLFRTPFDMGVRAQRHEILHKAYPYAKKKQKEILEIVKSAKVEGVVVEQENFQ